MNTALETQHSWDFFLFSWTIYGSFSSLEISFTPQGIRNIQRQSGQPGLSQGDIKQTWTHRSPRGQLGCLGRDDCQEIGLKVKLASSSLSVRDLRAHHHHLSMDSYFPTTSTPCKGFLDLLVCIQRAAAKIIVLANGLDHIIPPHTPPWQPLLSAPVVDGSSSPSQPFITHLSPTRHLPCHRGRVHHPLPTSPFTLCPTPGRRSL